MSVAGVIADRVRALVPITWDAIKSDVRIGDAPLQSAIDLAKETVTGVVVAEHEEELYPHIVIDFIAKTAVVEIIPMGIDFWMNKPTSISSTGTNELSSYTDRAKMLSDLRFTLAEELRVKQQEIAKIIGYWIDSGRAVPQLSSANVNPYHLTPSPEEFPRPYRQTQYS
jgi:hypothetical protein